MIWWIIGIIFFILVGLGNNINDKESLEKDECPRCHGSGKGMEIYEACDLCRDNGKYPRS